MEEVVAALDTAKDIDERPKAIVSVTQKGYGILPLLEEAGDTNFHGKPLPEEMAEKALELLA